MNFKPGDLAIISPKNHDFDIQEHAGKIVTLLSQYKFGGEIAWFTSPALFDAYQSEIAWDEVDLRPIGNPKDEDETLTWAGKPQEVAL